MLNADLRNISNAAYPAVMPSPTMVFHVEMASFITKLHTFRAAGSNDIPFYVV
jgi:hypothetical protein